MALTLGLDTALSGLLTAQQALNIVSQNITNVNTVGYTRKVVNQQSVTLNGQGAGVTIGQVGRPVDQQLLKNIRSQSSTLGQINSDQNYYSQIENMFGQVGDTTSIASTLTSLGTSLQSLSTTSSDPSQQFATMQSALDVTNQFNSMTTTMQNLRLSADSQISSDVTQVNTDLTTISSLNQKIVNAIATNSDSSDLQDQRDTAITDLSKYMSVTYFQDGNGAMNVYAGSGALLVNSAQTNLLSHPATTVTNATMSAASGDFAPITLSDDPTTDITGSLTSGELGSLINMRDTAIPNLQSQLDQTASQLMSTINQISNRGTTQPTLASSYSGTTTFATQGSVKPETDSSLILTAAQNGQVVTDNAGMSFSYSSTSGQITLAGTTTGSLAGLATPGTTFTVAGATTAGNDGTYTVSGYNSTTNTLTVSRANPVQTFSLANGADTAITLFDSSGNQIATTTLNAIMATDYNSSYTAGSQAAAQATAQPTGGPWSIDSFSDHMQAWLRAQGTAYAGATVGLDSSGKMQINLGSTVQASLAFRDQASSTPGSAAQDATVNFDANGALDTTGKAVSDQTVQGFANFFGLNDVFVDPQAGSVLDSAIQPANYTEPATTPQRTLSLADTSGQLGSTITIPAGSTLQNIATLINNATQTNESAAQSNTSFTLTSAATITVQDANGTEETQTVGPGTVTLQSLANALTTTGVTAQVVQNGSQYQLRLFSNTGKALTTTISGGNINNSSLTLGNQLNVSQTNHVQASVVPDGSGYRLQIVQTGGSTLFASANQDTSGTSILSDLGLGAAAAGTAGGIDVRSDLQSNPSKLPTGAVEWNSDTSQYYLSEGDNTTALQMSNAMSANVTMAAAGQIGTGSYTFSSYASASISLVAQASSNTTSQQSTQQTLSDSLNYQYTSQSGVNLDEEVANMTNYQQAYAASARVISTLNAMLSDLLDIVK